MDKFAEQVQIEAPAVAEVQRGGVVRRVLLAGGLLVGVPAAVVGVDAAAEQFEAATGVETPFGSERALAESVCVAVNPSTGECSAWVEVPDEPGGGNGSGSGSGSGGSGSGSGSGGSSSGGSSGSGSGSGSGGSSSGGGGSSGGGSSSGSSSSGGSSSNSNRPRSSTPAQPSWAEQIADVCADHEGDEALAAEADALRDPNAATEWERGSGYLVAALAECGVFFVDRNQDGVIDQADANPETGIGDTFIDQLLSDEVVVGNRSSNRMTPNGAQKALLDQARRDIWPVHVPAADDEALAGTVANEVVMTTPVTK